MTISLLFGLIAAAAVLLTIAGQASGRTSNIPVTFFRFFVGVLFIFSGTVKAIDPLGTAIKMEEYFDVFHEYVPFLGFLWDILGHQALWISIFMIVLEIFLGVTLILGVYRRLTIIALIAIILFFTILTGFSHVTGKVTDCGCFGDFLKLTPKQSFIKDIVLTVMIFILFFGRKSINALAGIGSLRLVTWVLTVLATGFTFRNYLDLPIVDFRAYKEGTNIPDCLSLPEDAKPYIYENVFVYRNKETLEIREFVNTFPSDLQNWDFVDRKDKLIQKGDDPKCKDFAIMDADGSDWSEEYLYMQEPLIIVSSHSIEKSSKKGFRKVSEFLKQADGDGVESIVITGSSLSDAEAFRHEMGIPSIFFNTDATPIKTMNRANPGISLIVDGTVIKKWHFRHLPDYASFKEKYLSKTE